MANNSQIECLCQMSNFILSANKINRFANMYTKRLIHNVHVFKTYHIQNINVLACFDFSSSIIFFATDDDVLDGNIQDQRYQAILFILKKEFENVSNQRNGKLKPNCPIDPPLIHQIKEITETKVSALTIKEINQIIYGFIISFKKYVNASIEQLLNRINKSKLDSIKKIKINISSKVKHIYLRIIGVFK